MSCLFFFKTYRIPPGFKLFHLRSSLNSSRPACRPAMALRRAAALCALGSAVPAVPWGSASCQAAPGCASLGLGGVRGGWGGGVKMFFFVFFVLSHFFKGFLLKLLVWCFVLVLRTSGDFLNVWALQALVEVVAKSRKMQNSLQKTTWESRSFSRIAS